MTSPHPLRHVGPKVFISYSFRDKALAQPLHERLVSMGFQVQREDEESLANLSLDQELQRRIESCEAFIQLRTETANRSDWMLREFDFARQRREHDAAYLLLPIVFDESSLPDRVRDWWYLSIGSAGLDDAGLDLVRRQLLATVRLLPLASDTPFEFDATAVQEAMAAEPTDRRVIIDSEGVLLSWMGKILEHIDRSNVGHRDAWLAQEVRHRDSLTEWLLSVDAAAQKLLAEVGATFADWENPAERGAEVVQRFCRFRVGLEVLRCAEQLVPATSPIWVAYAAAISAVKSRVGRRGATIDYDDLQRWALDPVGAESFVDVGLDARPGKEGVRLLLPERLLRVADLEPRVLLQLGSESPAGYLSQSEWADFALPQIAVTASRNVRPGPNAAHQLDSEWAWRVGDYRRMGLP